MSVQSFRGGVYEHRFQPIITARNTTLGNYVISQQDESGHIAKFLKGKDLFNYINTNQGVRTKRNLSLAQKEASRLQSTVMIYPSELIRACGGIAKMDSFPILELTEEKFGRNIHNSYIDFLQPEDFIGKA